MSIIEQIKALPNPLLINGRPSGPNIDRYFDTAKLLALAASHERLLELAKDTTRTGDGIAGWSVTHQELEKAIEEAEKL